MVRYCDSQSHITDEKWKAAHAPSMMATICTAWLTKPLVIPVTMAGTKQMSRMMSSMVMSRFWLNWRN